MDINEVEAALGLTKDRDGYHYDGENFTFPDEWNVLWTPLIAPNLRSVTLSASIKYISSDVFRNCPMLSEMIVPEDNETYFARDGILFRKEHTVASVWYANTERNVDLILPDGVETIGGHAFEKCKSIKSITLPSSLYEVWNGAFENNDTLTQVLIRNSEEPDKKIRLCQWAFRNCTALRSIVIEYGAPIEMSEGVFRGCTSLEQAVIPSCTGVIPENAFYSCGSLKSLYLPEGVTDIERFAFYDCQSLESVTLPDGLKKIGFLAFCSCGSLVDVEIPDSVTEIDDSAFSRTGLVSVKLGRGLRKIPSGMFSYCKKLRSVEIPEDVLIIDRYAFEECTSLESVTLPDGLRSIRHCAFSGCTALKHITIPSGVTRLEESAFQDCGLQSITHRGKTYHIHNKEDYASVISAIIEKVKELDRVTPKLKKTVWFWDYPDPYMDEFEYIGRDSDDEGFWNYKIVDEDYVLKNGEKESF